MTQHTQTVIKKLDAIEVRVAQFIRENRWTEAEWNAAIDEVVTLTGDSDSAGWLIGEALERSWIDRRISAQPSILEKRSA